MKVYFSLDYHESLVIHNHGNTSNKSNKKVKVNERNVTSINMKVDPRQMNLCR